MFLTIANVLGPRDVARVQKKADALDWVEGTRTASGRARAVKRNLQANLRTGPGEGLHTFLMDAITAHPSAWQGRETVPNTDRKFTMAPPVDRMQETALPLATVHVLERGAPRFAMEPVRGAARYALLRQQIFCPHFLPGTGASAAITSALIVLADRTPVVRVSIPDGLGAADLADRLSRTHASFGTTGSSSA